MTQTRSIISKGYLPTGTQVFNIIDNGQQIGCITKARKPFAKFVVSIGDLRGHFATMDDAVLFVAMN